MDRHHSRDVKLERIAHSPGAGDALLGDQLERAARARGEADPNTAVALASAPLKRSASRSAHSRASRRSSASTRCTTQPKYSARDSFALTVNLDRNAAAVTLREWMVGPRRYSDAEAVSDGAADRCREAVAGAPTSVPIAAESFGLDRLPDMA